MFTGSGTTGVACANLSRKFIGIEMDENYFSVAKERILKEKRMTQQEELRGSPLYNGLVV